MTSALRYGADSSLRLDLAGEALLAYCDAPSGEPLARVAEAVDRALAAPLEFPPLRQAVLPDDSVVLALADGVPRAATIVARTVGVLLAAGVAPHRIKLLRTQATAATGLDLLGELQPDVRAALECETHEPADRTALGYLAATAEGEPIYINRALHDADLVIPIGCLRLDESLDYHGIHSGLFPTFSDQRSLDRYRSPKSNEPPRREQLRHAADEVAWLLGVYFTIQVVPAAGGDVLQVLAGEMDAVLRQGRRRCKEAWCYTVPERASFVVTTIQGDATQQTWINVARALAAASHAVCEDGDVAICCELSEPLGPALRRIAGADNASAALRTIRGRKPADTMAAAELARALERGKVFLLSRLDDQVVEDLGVIPLAANQMSRLAARYDSCIVLSNAQYAQARTRDEMADRPALADPKLRK